MKENVLIFRNHVLPSTQTFIVAQAAALTRYEPRFAGLGPARESLDLAWPRVLMTTDNSRGSKIRRNLYKYTGVGQEFHRRVEQLKARVIHAHFVEDGIMSMPLARSLKLPLIVTLHGGFETMSDRAHQRSPNGLLYLLRRKSLWKEASEFICVSDFIRRKALAAGFPEEKLRVHYIGVDLSKFVPRDTERRRDLVLFVGRLAEKKGCEYLIRAMQKVQSERPSTELAIVGGGPLRESLEQLAGELAVRANFVGEQPPDVVRDWLARARLLCSPSVTAASGDSEGLPTVIAEAQAMGLPVVSSEHAGIPEIVRHGVTGLLAKERDWETLAAHILVLLSDDALCGNFGAEAISLTRQRFDLHEQTRKLEEIYSTAQC